jgi:hypothetical protein
MMRAVRVTTLVCALTVGVAGCGGGDTPADAKPAAGNTAPKTETADTDGRKVSFEAPGAPRPVLLTANCNPADPADCILPTSFPATEVTGDVRGTAFGTAVVIGRNGVNPGSSLSVFVGQVDGCGSGGLVINSVGTFDPSSGRTTGEWTVNADGGTGELADVAGGGTSVYDATGGHYEGRLRCR